MELGKVLVPVMVALILLSKLRASASCSPGACKSGEGCSSDSDCGVGLYCSSCQGGLDAKRCVRTIATNQFSILSGDLIVRLFVPQQNNSLPLNKYAFLTTHNAFAIDDGKPRLTFTNQEDSITQQLNNGVRALMLDTYDFEGDIWLCHSFEGKCHEYTKFVPAVEALTEIESFLSANPSEIVTLILEDYVKTPKGLTNVFTSAGLMKFWFPLSSMPKDGHDWPLVSDMVAKNQRLIVFTSAKDKESSEGIAHQWNYMVESQYGDKGMEDGNCFNRAESSSLSDRSKSLVLVNYFSSVPIKPIACLHNSGGLVSMVGTCYGASGNRWANFVAVDFYKRSEGGGTFQATDMLNGELLCGCNDVHSCLRGSGCKSV